MTGAQADAQPESASAAGPGTLLVEYLERLRAEGLTVIYSNTLVPDSLRLESAPIGATPRSRLASVLSYLGLSLEPGPQDTWIIVRSAAAAPGVERPADSPAPVYLPPPLENVIVTASRYAFSREAVASGSLVERLQIESTPSVGDDALRPVAVVPGVSSNGLSGRMAIRGGNTDEALILLDGIELSSPFHLRDFESIFGSVSPRVVEQMNVYTGAFSTRYGGRMSGVVDMQAATPEKRRHFEVGLSTINSSFLTSGRFDDGRSDWLVSIRRGTVDWLLDAANSDFGSPQFGDFFGRITRRIGRSGELRFGLMSLKDKLSFADGPQVGAGADYDDDYVWAGYSHEIGAALSADYLFWFADVDSSRDGVIDQPDVSIGWLSDRRSHSSAAFSGEWRYSPGDRHYLEWGMRFLQRDAQFEFSSDVDWPIPISSPLSNSGTGGYAFSGTFDDSQGSAFVNYRYRVRDALTLELGTRIDTQSSVDERVVSPRIGGVWDVGDRFRLRAAWGRYAQARTIDEIQVADRYPLMFRSQKSEQRILSLEFDPSDQTRVRLEIFDKDYTNPQPRFENLFTRLSLLPELLPDRVRLAPAQARASGIEISLDSELPAWRWWVSYSRSAAEDLMDGSWIRRSWSENWAAKAGFIWTRTRWNVAAVLLTRAGWPISKPRIENDQVVVPAFNDSAFESFRSLDVRATRSFALRRGKIELFAELINILDENNDCCYEYSVVTAPGGGISDIELNTQTWLPGVPVIGFLWAL